MSEVKSKAQLMARMADAYEALERVVAGLDEATLSRADPASGWSVKDHLFHLAAWERGIAWLLGRRSRFEGMGITPDEWRDLTMDEINDLVHLRSRERPAEEALEAFRGAHREMLDALAPLTEEDLMRPYADYDVVERAFPDRPIAGWIVGDTYEHYEEHLAYIQSLLAAGKA